jgi:hypothetical protein
MQHGGMLRQAMAKELEEVRQVCEQFFLYAIGENTSIFRYSSHRESHYLCVLDLRERRSTDRLLQPPTRWETAW